MMHSSVVFQVGEDDELSCLGFESDETEGFNDDDWTDWTGESAGPVCLFWYVSKLRDVAISRLEKSE